jgi:hypothetical protein
VQIDGRSEDGDLRDHRRRNEGDYERRKHGTTSAKEK